MYLLVTNVTSNEITEEIMTQAILKDTFTQQENEQVHTNEEEDPIKINSEVIVNTTNTISINITKVNCSSEKIYGPVEVYVEHIKQYYIR